MPQRCRERTRDQTRRVYIGLSTYSDRFTVFFDAEGNVTRFTEFVSAPHDVWTNTATGKSITVRGHFVQVATRIPGTDTFDRTVTGFRYLVNKLGEGVAFVMSDGSSTTTSLNSPGAT